MSHNFFQRVSEGKKWEHEVRDRLESIGFEVMDFTRDYQFPDYKVVDIYNNIYWVECKKFNHSRYPDKHKVQCGSYRNGKYTNQWSRYSWENRTKFPDKFYIYWTPDDVGEVFKWREIVSHVDQEFAQVWQDGRDFQYFYLFNRYTGTPMNEFFAELLTRPL